MTAAPWQPSVSLAWLQALRQPQLALGWSLAEWERVVRLSRRLRLLSRLAESIDAAGLIDRVPAQARRHLISEQRLSRWRTAAMVWVLDRVATTLGDGAYPLVLLKGSAYLGQDLRIAAGRLPSDVDILLPRAHIDHAVAQLKQAGWSEPELDAHDRRYYYEWSHEVPPMRHPLYGMELDLHHNILPPVAAVRVDADALLQDLRPTKWARWQVLAPVDQVLHSAAHLFFDSEARDRIRDLVDLDGLLRHFSAEPDFWARLPDRARALGLVEPLALAFHYTRQWLGTPIPDDVVAQVASLGPGRLRRTWLLPLMDRILTPAEPDIPSPASQDLAALINLIRYHWGRMPLRLLIPHLWHKLRAGPAD
jgi:hypothetical protein